MRKLLLLIYLFITSFSGNAQTIITIAGNWNPGCFGDGGPATAASFNNPAGMCFDGSGNLYIADPTGGRIRKIDATGIITTVAGNGSWGFSGDGGSATAAKLALPSDVSVDREGNLYIADNMNYCVRKVSPSGIISTFAGTPGTGDHTGDGGHATNAKLNPVRGIYRDGSGNTYICEGCYIRKIDSSGVISTVAGTPFTFGYGGDGGQATAAILNTAMRLVKDAAGNIYFSDDRNNRVRKIDPSGVISNFAGNGTASSTGDNGPATAAGLNAPAALALDANGNLYIGEQNGSRIRKVSPSGIISTAIGTGDDGFSGDGGSASAAKIGSPRGIAINSNGDIYYSDASLGRVRKIFVCPPLVVAPINGPATACLNDRTTLTCATFDGTWTSSDPSTAAVSSAGVVTGNRTGTVIITYTVTDACNVPTYVTKTITVKGTTYPASIAGTDTAVCANSKINFSCSTPNGIWSSSNPSIATVTNTGTVTGIAAGTVVVSYIIINECSFAGSSTRAVTVNVPPIAGTIIGPRNICTTGGTVTYTNSGTGGGIWSVTNPSCATVTGNGVFYPLNVSGTTLKYAVTNNCGSSNTSIDVITTPAGIPLATTGPLRVCKGATVTFSNTTVGGKWTTANPAIATVDSTGVVTGIAAVMTIITYSVTNNCGTYTSPRNIIVDVTPPAGTTIVATDSTIASGATLKLQHTGGTGTWSSSNPVVASVSTDGTVTGNSPGSCTINYSVTNGCGTQTADQPFTVTGH